MKRIPRTPHTTDAGRAAFDDAVKDTIERLTGVRGGKIAPLPNNASTDEMITKINEVISRITA